MLYDLLRVLIVLGFVLAVFAVMRLLVNSTVKRQMDAYNGLDDWLRSRPEYFQQCFERFVATIATQNGRLDSEISDALQGLDLPEFRAIAAQYGLTETETVEAFAGANPQYYRYWLLRRYGL